MDWLRRKRVFQVLKYGWTDSKKIAKKSGRKRLWEYFSLLLCFKKHYVFSNQYTKNKLWALPNKEREKCANEIGTGNKRHDNWVIYNYHNRKFIEKWSSFKWETTPKRILKRKQAYTKQYGLGKNLHIQYGVTILCEHFYIGKITCGENVLFARNCDIDYTGDIVIGNHVSISEGVKILTHNHSTEIGKKDLRKGCLQTPLKIYDHVWIGARATIMPGVKEIGRCAIISAGSYINSKIPPYAIVLGNPAKIVGFRMPLEDIFEYEKIHYKEDDRIPVDVLSNNYNKYYRSRWKEIRQWNRH